MRFPLIKIKFGFLTLAIASFSLTAFAAGPSDKPTPEVKHDRTSLPIPEPDYPRSTVLDARDAKAPPRFEVKAPAGAPNVLIVLVDDMGFGMPSAFGNSDGDFQMLEWTTAGKGPRFVLIVHHDDAAREWAYDRESHIGKLDKGLDEAKAKGWTVVSMKDDWSRIYP